MSASADEPTALLREAGFSGFLRKPFTARSFQALMGASAGRDTARSQGLSAMARAEDALLALASCRKIRVLLAEDNELNREVAVDLLTAVGIEVDQAVDGREAVALATTSAYDLILMDVHMPNLNGLDATRLIRETAGYAHTPIFAMTASAFIEDREECRVAGMSGYVAKPVEPEELYATLLHWLPESCSGEQPSWGGPKTGADNAPNSPSDIGTRARLEKVDGLAINVGLRSVRGQLTSYVRLLGMFCANHADDMFRLEEHLKRGDREGSRMIAHALKGVAGALGMTRIQELATSLDAALKKNAPDEAIEGDVRAIREAVQKTIREIRDAIPKHVGREPIGDADLLKGPGGAARAAGG